MTKLILEGKLAPFYRGLEDVEEDWDENKISEVLEELREKDYEEGVANSVVAKMKEEREPTSHGVGSVVKKIGIHKGRDLRVQEEKEERDRRERKAYSKTEECPICFLVSLSPVHDTMVAEPRTIRITLTLPDVASNPSAPNVSSRYTAQKPL